MMKKLFSKIRLSYQNPTQELEYCEFKAPLIKDLCIWLFMFIALLFVPLTFRYYEKDLYPQVYLGLSFLGLAVVIFFFRSKLQKYLEFISIMYLIFILSLYITNMKLILDIQKPHEAFYMGYGIALVQRMLDYRISKFPVFISFNIIFTILKFAIVTIPGVAQGGLVACLEIFPLLLSFKVERAERVLFDSFHKSKCQLLKFKKCLTEYFPNQVIVLDQEQQETFFVNNSFKKAFECADIHQLKKSLQKLVIDHESVEQNKDLFDLLGHNTSNSSPDPNQTWQLSNFLEVLSGKIRDLPTSKPITLHINQHDFEEAKSLPNENKGSQNLNQQEDHTLLIKDGNFYAQNEEDINLSEKHNSDLDKFPKRDEPDRITSRLDNHLISKNANLLEGERSELNPINNESDEKTLRNSSVMRKIIWKATIFPLLWDNNDAIAILLDDVTHERTILELELADKNKDMVIAMVSHELRTPLNGMLGMLDIVEKRLKSFEIDTKSEVFYYLNAFRISSQFLLNLVNSILDFSQFKNNKLTLDYSYVNISELLEQIRPLFDHFCKTKNLFLKIHVDPGVPHTIFTDHGRLSQILINLIGNAFKFTFDGGVTVNVTPERHFPYRVRITVEDTGVGIKKEDIEKLFNLFGRLEEHKKINAQGVGLGLTLSNTLAKLLDSDNSKGIEVISEIGKGSTFTFTIENKCIDCKSGEIVESSMNEQQEPHDVQDKMSYYYHEMKNKTCLEISTASKETPKESLLKKSSQDNMAKDWCLLVDDNPFNLMVAEHLMEDRGYKVKTALNGKEAIEKVQEHQKSGYVFRVILMDCEMPVMNGYEATKILTKMMKEGEVVECPIVAATANINNDRQKMLYKEAGMSGFIPKPLQKDKLEQILRRFQKK